MIYLVEDDESIRNMMMYTLEASGFEVKGFENGKSYFQAMLMNHPDLVMLDIMLPDMDGIEILKKMKKDPEMKDIPVIMASAKGTEYDKVIGLDLGLFGQTFWHDGNGFSCQSRFATDQT